MTFTDKWTFTIKNQLYLFIGTMNSSSNTSLFLVAWIPPLSLSLSLSLFLTRQNKRANFRLRCFWLKDMWLPHCIPVCADETLPSSGYRRRRPCERENMHRLLAVHHWGAAASVHGLTIQTRVGSSFFWTTKFSTILLSCHINAWGMSDTASFPPGWIVCYVMLCSLLSKSTRMK